MSATLRPMVALDVAGLTKRYGAVRALEQVSFSVAPGEIFGYLGPNGAGKTTTLRILAGLVRADAGEMRLLGRPARAAAARASVGYLPGDLKLHGMRHGYATLGLAAGLRPEVMIDLMGHSSTRILKRYQDVIRALRRDAADQFDRLLTTSEVGL